MVVVVVVVAVAADLVAVLYPCCAEAVALPIPPASCLVWAGRPTAQTLCLHLNEQRDCLNC